MEAKSFKNREKSDAKIDQKIDAFEDRILMRFGRILGGNMEATWHQNQRNIDASFERPFFEKTLFFHRRFNDFEGSRGCKIGGKSMNILMDFKIKLRTEQTIQSLISKMVRKIQLFIFIPIPYGFEVKANEIMNKKRLNQT